MPIASRAALALAAAMVLTSAAAHSGAQAMTPAILINRMSSAYRSMQTYSDIATWKIRSGEKEITANITLAAARPNRYALEIKSEGPNLTVWSDGAVLSGLHGDRKALAKTKAPLRLIGSNVLAGIDLQMLGVRMITLLLEGGLRDMDPDLTRAFQDARVTPAQAFGAKLAYVLTFPWDRDFEARVYVTTDDLLIRRVVLLRNGNVEWIESHDSIQVDQPIPNDTFTRTVPEGTKAVAVLPPLEKLTTESAGPIAPDFAIEALDGTKIRLSELKGKAVLLVFGSLEDEASAAELPKYNDLHREYKSKGLEIIAIFDKMEDPAAIAEYLKMKGSFYKAALNEPTDVVELYKIQEAPAAVLINREGRIAAKIPGGSIVRIKSALKKLGFGAE